MQIPTIGDLAHPGRADAAGGRTGLIGQPARHHAPTRRGINRIEDITGDYEESERVAAKIAAMMTGYAKRVAPTSEGHTPQLGRERRSGRREIGLAPDIIDSWPSARSASSTPAGRTSTGALRNGQLRAFASASLPAHRRQPQLRRHVQPRSDRNWSDMGALRGAHRRPVGQCSTVVEDFILVAHLSGAAPKPADLKRAANSTCSTQPSMPWIDRRRRWPGLTLVKAGFASEVEVIRKRGQSPEALLEQVALWRKKCADRALPSTAMPCSNCC